MLTTWSTSERLQHSTSGFSPSIKNNKSTQTAKILYYVCILAFHQQGLRAQDFHYTTASDVVWFGI